ncbi:MAG TPA: TonB family protein [Polyangiaceae bacterium]|nr:TonB family protein [Polyangiaceae bacterium]
MTRTCLIVAALFWVKPALAQTVPAEPEKSAAPAQVTPPKLTRDPGVAYPRAALEAGEFSTIRVDLVLEIGVDGSVRNATLERPGLPLFDSAALAAARELQFEPARRAEKPVPAKIRFLYTFSAPPSLLSATVSDRQSGGPVPGARLRVHASDQRDYSLEPDAKGEFRSDSLPRGAAKVRIEAPGFTAQTAEIDLNPLSETRIQVELAREATELAAAGGNRAPEQPIEVVVQGERLAPGVSSLTRAEVRQLPGAFGDPFRAIEALPGVTPMISGLPFFYVRGAPPGNVGYFVDGIRIPFLYHVAIGPSVIHPALVDRVDLYPGGYPARFGRYAGGIVSAETTEPRYDLHGEANIRPFDAGALVETGFADGKGSLLLGGRYSFTAALFSLLVPDLKLDYRDYQARVSYAVTPRDQISLLGLGSYDLLAQKQGDGLNVLFGAEFYRLGLRHEHRFDKGSLDTSLTLGFDQSHFADQGNAIDRSLAARSEYRTELASRALFRLGGDVVLDQYSTAKPKYTDPDDPETGAFARNNPSRIDVNTASGPTSC